MKRQTASNAGFRSPDDGGVLAVQVTSSDQDQADWVKLLKKEEEAVLYFATVSAPDDGGEGCLTGSVGDSMEGEAGLDMVSAPYHGSEERAKASVWGSWLSWKTLLRPPFVGTGHSARRLTVARERPRIGQPPRVALFALLMIPKKNREHLVGDLEEEYRTHVLPQYGRLWAGIWYWVQAIQAVGFYVWPLLKRVLGMAAIWKVIGR